MEFTIDDFKAMNKGNENLGSYFGDWTPANGFPFVFNEKKVQENFDIFQEIQKSRFIINPKPIHPRNGDIIYLPKNKMVYVCHVFDTKIQTTKGGSFSLHPSGGMSYSGGLDAGLKKEDLVESDEQNFCPCWFPEGNRLRAHSAVFAKVKVRVWKVKIGADLSGIWQSIEKSNLKLF